MSVHGVIQGSVCCVGLELQAGKTSLEGCVCNGSDVGENACVGKYWEERVWGGEVRRLSVGERL